MYTPFPRVSTGNYYTVLDATAKNTLGSIWSPPANAGAPYTTKGFGAQLVVKYVYYNSTSNPAPVAGPAPVYYTDESFTTVSGNAAEAFVTTNGLYVAGYILPNTTAISGLTAATLNQSYLFMAIGGLLPGAWAPTTTPGAGLGIGGLAAGNWASVATAGGPAGRALGWQLTAAVSSLCDILVEGDCFWGS